MSSESTKSTGSISQSSETLLQCLKEFAKTHQIQLDTRGGYNKVKLTILQLNRLACLTKVLYSLALPHIPVSFTPFDIYYKPKRPGEIVCRDEYGDEYDDGLDDYFDNDYTEVESGKKADIFKSLNVSEEVKSKFTELESIDRTPVCFPFVLSVGTIDIPLIDYYKSRLERKVYSLSVHDTKALNNEKDHLRKYLLSHKKHELEKRNFTPARQFMSERFNDEEEKHIHQIVLVQLHYYPTNFKLVHGSEQGICLVPYYRMKLVSGRHRAMFLIQQYNLYNYIEESVFLFLSSSNYLHA